MRWEQQPTRKLITAKEKNEKKSKIIVSSIRNLYLCAQKIMNMDEYRFRVDILDDAKEFLDGLDKKARKKILYNVWKSRKTTDNELFKKLQDEIWEFRTVFNKTYYRLFAFWDKTDNAETVVISTHGLVKKTDKIPKSEIERAEKIREKYFNEKTSKK
jgi:phage-related protein